METNEILSKYDIRACSTEDRRNAISELLNDETLSRDDIVDAIMVATAPPLSVANFHHDLMTFSR